MFRELRTAKASDEMTLDEWTVMFRQAIEGLNDWQSNDGESESDIFNQKSVLFRMAYDFTPEGKLREYLTLNFVKLLESSIVQKQSFIEWLVHARWLGNEDRDVFAKAVSNSPSPNLRLLVTSLK